VTDGDRVRRGHQLAWGPVWRTALVAACAWTALVVVVLGAGRPGALTVLAATVLAGLAVGVRLPAAAPARVRVRSPR